MTFGEWLKWFGNLFVKEILTYFIDPASRFILIVPLIIQIFLFGYTATFDLNHAPIAVLNESHGKYSQQLVAQVGASPTFYIRRYLQNASQMKDELNPRDSLAIVHIQSDFDSKLAQGKEGPVQIITDGRNSTTAGLAAAERIKKVFPQIKIVVATSLVDPEVLQRAKMGAADSLWYKDHGTEELISVVKRTLAGEKVFPDTAPAIEMEGTMSDAFSPRQLDILRLYIKGFTYQEIADKLGISKNGVRWNLDDMVEKSGFESREALVATAIENKLMVTTLKDE